MDFKDYYKNISENQLDACGVSVSKLIPEGRQMLPDQAVNPMKSGVMIVCYYEQDELMVVFIRRTEDMGVHSGQIAFPGGRYDDVAGDENTLDTAIRETWEETGLRLEKDHVLCSLSSLYVPPSNFLMDPYVAMVETKPMLTPNPAEVAEIIHIPLKSLSDDACIINSEFKTIRGMVTAPCYDLKYLKIWGATAVILSQFICLEKKRMGVR